MSNFQEARKTRDVFTETRIFWEANQFVKKEEITSMDISFNILRLSDEGCADEMKKRIVFGNSEETYLILRKFGMI